MPNLSINHLNHCISSNKSVSAHLNWIPKQKMQFSTSAANVLVNLVLCVHGRTVIAIFSHVATCLNAKSIEICFSYLKDPVRVPLVKRWTYLPTKYSLLYCQIQKIWDLFTVKLFPAEKLLFRLHISKRLSKYQQQCCYGSFEWDGIT